MDRILPFCTCANLPVPCPCYETSGTFTTRCFLTTITSCGDLKQRIAKHKLKSTTHQNATYMTMQHHNSHKFLRKGLGKESNIERHGQSRRVPKVPAIAVPPLEPGSSARTG